MKFNLLQGFYPTFCRLSQEFHLINNISHQLFLATLPYSTTRGIVLALRAVYSPIPCLTGQKGISSLCSDIPIALAGRALAQDSSIFRKRKENCFSPFPYKQSWYNCQKWLVTMTKLVGEFHL